MSKKILIVDDEQDLVDMVSIRLEAAGFEIITASDGLEGLNKAKAENPDLIILDVMMPKMDGNKVCGLLKADARYKKIPIIMFTARVQDAVRKLSQELGADAFMNKPLNPQEMMDHIKKLLG